MPKLVAETARDAAAGDDAGAGLERPRIAVVVAGMHRSGTSALTRLLVGLGCTPPRTPLAADAHNALGYWESSVITELNDAILASAGSSWDDWGVFNPAWQDSPAARPYRNRALQALVGEFGDSPLFVLKDPRLCRLLPVWRDWLAEVGATPRVVVPVRNPLEVAASLARRDVIEEPFGALLWLRHMLDAEAGCRDGRRAFVHYDDVLGNWQAAAERLGRGLAIAWPRRSTVAAVEIEENLPPALKHQVRTDAQVADAPMLAAWVKSTYAVLSRWARDDRRAGDEATLDAARASLAEAEPVFRPTLLLGQGARQRVAKLDIELAERRREIDGLAAELAAKDGELAQLGETLTERDVRIDALQHEVLARDGRLAELDARRREIDGLRAELAQLGGTLTERDARIDALQHEVLARDGRLAERDAKVAALEQEMERRLGAVVAANELLEARVAGQARELDALSASTSWRITRPLRAVKRMLLAIRRRGARAPRSAILRPARRLWHWLPLTRAQREGVHGAGLASGDALRYDRAGGYVASGRLELAERNHQAAQGKGRVPVLFDAAWYLANNGDVERAGADPLDHYLECGATEGRLPLAIDPGDIDPMIESLHRLNQEDASAFEFDGAFYVALHPDLLPLDEAELARHYEAHGKAESRVGSKGKFVASFCRRPAEIPLDFRADEYIDLYPDLAGFRERPALEALRHYMLHGRWEPRLHTLRGDAPPPAERPAAAPVMVGAPRALCVLVHVYYPELWPELAAYIANLPRASHDLYVNLVDGTFSQQLLTDIRAAFPEARIYISENAGRDIGGHFQLLRNLRIEDYAVFCLLHTKRSPHMAPGEVQRWRRRLLLPLLGSPERALENLELLRTDAAIGQLGAEACRYTELGANSEKYLEALKRLGIEEDASQVEFLTGTMMFVRADVLRRVFERLRDVPFEAGDGRDTAFHRDGQWAHAVERAIGAVVRDMGYRCAWRPAEGA